MNLERVVEADVADLTDVADPDATMTASSGRGGTRVEAELVVRSVLAEEGLRGVMVRV